MRPILGALLAHAAVGMLLRDQEDRRDVVNIEDVYSWAGELPKKTSWRGVLLDELHDRPINPFESRQVRRARLRRERKAYPHD